MKFKVFLVVALAALVFFGCSDDKKEESAQQNQTEQTAMTAADVHKVVVEEILQANAYTYLRVNEDGKEDWLAITKNPNIVVGNTIFYKDAMEMKNFHSTDLDRDFESVWFVQSVSMQPMESNPTMSASPHSNIQPEADEKISIQPAEDGITIAKLFDNETSYEGKSVKIRGKVVKVNNGIMGRNWIHIQDGTGDDNNYDLTVTTDDKANVGQIVVVEGYVTLNKDFGSGYKYDVILEDSKVTPETTM